MSDTPRTDAEGTELVAIGLARTLERENAALREELTCTKEELELLQATMNEIRQS